MTGKTQSIGLLADFNVQNLAVLLQKSAPTRQCTNAPLGQTLSLLLNPDAEFWSPGYDTLLIWTDPERALPTFSKILALEPFRLEDLMQDVESFVAVLRQVPETVRTILLPTWVQVRPSWNSSMLRNGLNAAHALMAANLRLTDLLQEDPRVIVLDSQVWMGGGPGAFDPKLWYLSKTPFHPRVFEEVVRDVSAVLDGLQGKSRKVIILDLDDTLWGGIVGEEGWQKLRLGGHDPVGEAFVDFQKSLKLLSQRGIVLAVVSKNEESVALQAISGHPEMVLKLDNFAGWRINWQDKAANIVQLLDELNLGVESAVFLDDSPFERARVREALPQLLVPELPSSPLQYPGFLAGLRCFENSSLSLEDRTRTQMYVADRSRSKLKKDVTSLHDWLAMLELRVELERLSPKNLERAAQLFNKTNQMNLSTRRLAATELLSWSQEDGQALWTFRVRDKFGDYGLCGIGSLVWKGESAQIVDFLLSCRVMGRGIEQTMLAMILQNAKSAGCTRVSVQFIPTPRNTPCRKWLEAVPGIEIEGNTFALSPAAVGVPDYVTVTLIESDEQVLV